MLEFILMLCLVLIFTRIYLNKFDVKNKDVFSIAIATIITLFFTLIQLILDFMLGLIF